MIESMTDKQIADAVRTQYKQLHGKVMPDDTHTLFCISATTVFLVSILRSTNAGKLQFTIGDGDGAVGIVYRLATAAELAEDSQND